MKQKEQQASEESEVSTELQRSISLKTNETKPSQRCYKSIVDSEGQVFVATNSLSTNRCKNNNSEIM